MSITVKLDDLGGDGLTIVAIDFRRSDTTETIVEAVANRTAGRLYRIDPVTDLTSAGTPPTIDELARAYVDRLENITPDVIIGTCSGAPLTTMIASTLEERTSTTIRTILLRPAWVDDQRVLDEFDGLCRSLGTDSSERTLFTIDDSGDRLTAMVDTLSAELQKRLTTEGIPKEDFQVIEDSLLPRYRAWLAFLIAATTARLTAPAQLTIFGDAVDPPTDRVPDTWALTQVPVNGESPLRPGTPSNQQLLDYLTPEGRSA